METKKTKTDLNNENGALIQSCVITGALISLSDFLSNNIETGCLVKAMAKLTKYAEFLKQPLTLGMFIPCKENGEIINEPSPLQKESDFEHHRRYYAEYLEAKERVLFKGFEFKQNGFYCSKNQVIQQYKKNKFSIFNIIGENSYTVYVERIEDLVKYNLTLTDNAFSEHFS